VGWQTAAIFAVGFAILFSLSGAIFGINRIAWSQASGEDALILVPAILLAAVIASTANLMIDNQYRGSPPLLPPLMILMAAFIASGGFLTVRFRYRILRGFERRWIGRWTKTSLGQERVLVVGGGESGQLAAALLSTSSYASHFKVIGFVDDDLYIQGIRFHGIEVLGRRQDLPQLVEKHDVGLLLFSIHNISARERRDLLNICDATQARTVLFPDMPGALNTLVSAKVKTISSNILPEAVNGKLPCHICLIKLSPMVIDGWLAGLQESAQAGDLESLNQELTRLRDLLSADSLLQRQANQEFFAEKQVKFER
jgi:FlaA1/EpsC-like NDP-sugar epimerase